MEKQLHILCSCFLSILTVSVVTIVKGVVRMNTVLLAAMHFVVDFICAWAMYGFFRQGSGGYENLLIYNFCAFALQMPLGTILDLLKERIDGKIRNRFSMIWAVFGAVLTAVGALIHPAMLGLGNALFHLGGGMEVIEEDLARNLKGRDLGVFVAPGAIGLYLGAKAGTELLVLVLAALAAAILAIVLFWNKGRKAFEQLPVEKKTSEKIWLLAVCCFAVVILRSYVGLSVNFSWKSGAVFGLLAVLAVAVGKVSGGILGARFGSGRTVCISLLLAAACFAMGDTPVFGLAALLLFNMSMPVTLYMLARALPHLPGFSFGLLTFGLFLGFLPVYGGIDLHLTGAVGSIISAVLLIIGEKAVRKDHVSS